MTTNPDFDKRLEEMTEEERAALVRNANALDPEGLPIRGLTTEEIRRRLDPSPYQELI